MLLVAEAGAPEPFAAGIRSFLADPTTRYAPLWRGAGPSRDGTLDPAALLDRAAGRGGGAARPLGDRDRYLADGLRELMFFYLFQAGERLSRDADERLGHEVKRRFEALGQR